MDPQSPPPPAFSPSLWQQPVRILASGLALLVLVLLGEEAGLPSPARAVEGLAHQPALIAALLIFLVGIGFAAFLWWLASRSFALLRDPHTTPEQLASLRDLPLALPEGTVRAVLALIVGVVGLPLLLFS